MVDYLHTYPVDEAATRRAVWWTSDQTGIFMLLEVDCAQPRVRLAGISFKEPTEAITAEVYTDSNKWSPATGMNAQMREQACSIQPVNQNQDEERS